MKNLPLLISVCSFFFLNQGKAQELLFADISDSLHIEEVSFALEEYGGGISAEDYDLDGDIDFFLSLAKGVSNRLYQNLGDGTFEEIAMQAGLDLTLQTKAALWVDIDNDGLPDLYLVGDCHEIASGGCSFAKLYIQQQDHTFVDHTEPSNVGIDARLGNSKNDVSIGGIAAGDLNHDGYVDLLVSLWGARFAVYTNNGDQTFHVDVYGDIKHRWQPMIHDFDGDGYQDIYINVDFAPNEFWRNQGDGTFKEEGQQLKIDNDMSDMGMSFTDYDNDGDFDIYITNITGNQNIDRNVLYENISSPHRGIKMREVAEELGVSESGWDWGVAFADFSNDGWPDLATTNGHKNGSDFEHDQSNLWIRIPNGKFEKVTSTSGFSDTLNAATLIAVDIDRDGDQDLLQSIKKTVGIPTTIPLRVYENQLGQSNNYVVIKPRQATRNIFAIGAAVQVTTSAGMQSRLITAGSSFYGQEPAEAHFGLGALTEVEKVTVIWPDGAESTHTNIPINQVVTLNRPNRLSKPEAFTVQETAGFARLQWARETDRELELERVIIGQETQLLSLGTDSTFVDPVKLDSFEYKYRVRFTTADQKSAWTSYQEVKKTDNGTTGSSFELDIPIDTSVYSVARLWNEVLLEAIRNDLARPTVHARNLFHISAAMYDAWAVFEQDYTHYLLGKSLNGFVSNFDAFLYSHQITGRLQDQAISFAAYRMIKHRFRHSPGKLGTYKLSEKLMQELGYDPEDTNSDYSLGSAAALGNYIAEQYIQYGLQDHSNEVNDYANQYYEPINAFLDPETTGNPTLTDPNRWQPLAFDVFIDQSGNEIAGSVPPFLGAEWGHVIPFALTEANKTVFQRDGHDYPVYFDPGPPPYMTTDGQGTSDEYRHGFSMVAVWSGHLDTDLEAAIDISPASLGNFDLSTAPLNPEDFDQFYKFLEGGDPSMGHDKNPFTDQPYESQVVKMGDYGRILAEFWADGPDSETPPGHWFTILNKVSDDEHLVKKLGGQGELLDKLEWDIKSYFILGGTMHDVAITAWGIKGYYDYVRPISAIRYMADKGQSSDPQLPAYDPQGIELVDGYIELVGEDDPLAGSEKENVGKIKLYAWKGHEYIADVTTDVAGVDWILAEDWWPYQRPTFVTPNFAGYVSGHSTYSRAAAEVMTRLTGDAFFPGGMGEFEAQKDEFLVFEDGPSKDITLQWATYRDASDQCSLSRIWGGIHPPADDLPARVIGEQVGNQAFDFGVSHFPEVILGTISYDRTETLVYPVPTNEVLNVKIPSLNETPIEYTIYDLTGRTMKYSKEENNDFHISLTHLKSGKYILHLKSSGINTYRYLLKE